MLCASIVISASAFLAKKPVKAVDRGFLSYTPSQADIDNAKKQRDEAKRKAQNASEQVDQLKKEKNQLSGELEELRGLSDEQMAQYTGAFTRAIEEEMASFAPDIIHGQHVWILP